ncbi:MAG: right-handed parallel beta-helix repeat-containing protein [Chromatiales bacterium]|nr:right-handed parallel beta-helix repeat-containing protein [Chromatiales bacterium]
MLTALLMALLPPCDFTVRTAEDWSHVNDADKRVVCVAPAPTYTVEQVGVIHLSASGSADQPRWLRWANDDESVHPALVPERETAAVAQFYITGSHWIVDRLVVRDAVYQPQVAGTGNTLQRMVFEKPRAWEGRPVNLMLHFTSGSDHAVVDSVFREGLRVPRMDSYAVYIHEAERVTIRGNEFIDLVDGVSNGPLAGGGNRIVGNEFYHTPATYTDCKGHFNPAGKCSCSEGMAIVPKGPAERPESYIEGNLVWGFRKTDPFCAGTGTPGVAIDLGSGEAMTRNFVIRDNIILADVPNAIYLGRYVEDVAIAGNYIAGAEYGIANVYGQRVRVTGNTFYRVGIDHHTGPVARGTVLSGNRRAGRQERCFTVRHLTRPEERCTPF